jgi:hypothetical protein
LDRDRDNGLVHARQRTGGHRSRADSW